VLENFDAQYSPGEMQRCRVGLQTHLFLLLALRSGARKMFLRVHRPFTIVLDNPHDSVLGLFRRMSLSDELCELGKKSVLVNS
jgi:hypothetical protein